MLAPGGAVAGEKYLDGSDGSDGFTVPEYCDFKLLFLSAACDVAVIVIPFLDLAFRFSSGEVYIGLPNKAQDAGCESFW